MNVLFKNRYFRRECFAHTWKPYGAIIHDKTWYFDYNTIDVSMVENRTFFFTLCKKGTLDIIKQCKGWYKKSRFVVWFEEHTLYLLLQTQCYNVETHGDYVCTQKVIDDALKICAYYNHIEIVKYLINKGADINAGNKYMIPNYPLTLSSTQGNIEIIRYLVEHGANIQDVMYEAHLCRRDNLDIIKYLVKHGFNIHEHDGALLLYSAINGHLEIVRYLVEHGAYINECEHAFIRSAQYGHLHIVQYFVEEYNIDVNCTNGHCALYWSIYDGQFKVVQYLVEHGANIDSGLRLIEYMTLQKYPEIDIYLQKKKKTAP